MNKNNVVKTLSLPVRIASALAEQVKDQPSDKQVQTVIEDKHFPQLSKEQRVVILHGLRRQEALQIRNWSDDFYEHPEELQELIVVYSKTSITRFLEAACDPILQLDISNGGQQQLVAQTMTQLASAKQDKLDIKNFDIDKGTSPVEKIADYTGAVEIEMTLEGEYDEDGMAHAGYFPSAVLIKDEDRLHQIHSTLRAAVVASQGVDIDGFLQYHPSTQWRCQNCSRFFEALDTKENIADHLFSFTARVFKPCYKCRAHNAFTIQQGNIAFRLEKKESRELPDTFSLDLKR